MNYFEYRNGALHAESVPFARIAEQYGTPCFVYSRAALSDAYRAFDTAFAAHDHLVCYAVKANSNLAILNIFARMGSGFDIVSGGELARVIAADGDPGKTVFSGVGKSVEEIRQALNAGILCFNVESASELARIDRIGCEMGKIAPISVRVNPDVDAKTHPYIATGLRQNKFGVPYSEAAALYRHAHTLRHVRITGIDCHIGSQLTEISPFVAALDKILTLVDALQRDGIAISHLDLGGGLGIRYQADEHPPAVGKYASAVLERLRHRPQKLLFEPGRLLTGNAGVLLTRIEYLKHGEEKNFAVVDAAMNDLLRPALYDAWHDIEPAVQTKTPEKIWDIVGPVCETGDFLAHNRKLRISEGDLLVVRSAGAYGMSMSSNYNTRPRAIEIMVDGDATHLIRQRESVAELFAHEMLLP